VPNSTQVCSSRFQSPAVGQLRSLLFWDVMQHRDYLNHADGSDTLPQNVGIARSKSEGTRAETRFGLSAKRTSPFKSAGVLVQSTAGSRGVRISRQQLYRPCSDVQCKTTGYPFHSHLFPSLPLPCVTVCHQVLNAL